MSLSFVWLKKGVFFVSVVVFLLLLSAHSVGAQGGAGIGITPAIIENAAEPGTQQRHEVTISNLSGMDQKYYVYVRNIVGVKEDNSPVYADDDREVTPYELSSWVAIDVGEVDVPAQGQARVGFTISVPSDASPGSHFGSIFVSVEPPRLRTTGASVGYEVANIINIQVAGEVDDRAEIRQFSTDQYVYGATEVDFSLHIENQGNILIRPTGPVEITNMFGKQVALFTFNESQGAVFPKAIREYKFSWQGDGIGFGRYEARVSPLYGENGRKKTLTSTVSFWVLPMNIIGPAALILGVLLLTIYVSIRLYVRRTVAILSAGADRRITRSSVRRRGNPIFMLSFVAMSTATVLFLIILLLLFA